MAHQLALPLEKEGLRRFETFDPQGNILTVKMLEHWPSDFKMIYLEGPHRSGKTHLAEALAERALQEGKQILFLSGKILPAPHFFYELPLIDYLILDDVDHLLLFSSQYEEALFALYNQIFDMKTAHLLLTSSTPINALPIKLKDLKSRLQGIHPLGLKPNKNPTITT